MYWCQTFILLLGIYLSDAGYGTGNMNYYVTPDAQSDVEAPEYLPPYLKHQQFSSHSYGGSAGGTKTVYGGTKNVYSGTKNVYSGTKNVYSGTKNVYSGTGQGGGGYSQSRQWYSNSGAAPNYQEFFANANKQYQPNCEPECKNSGICVDTNTCECPANYHGTYCEFEKKPCLNFPPLPMNSHRKCTTDQCTITCMQGHKFIDGSTVANMRCTEGQWTPSRADITIIPDCQPECDPPCLNGGACLALNTCQCPAAYRGPQCQYSETVCDARKLAFNGGYKCFGDESKLKCKLSCPAGSQFSSAPASVYTCQYAAGVFQPQPIPHCVFTDVVVITPMNQHNNSFYSYHSESSHTGHNESFTDSHYGSSHYGSAVQVVMQDLTPKGGTCLTWAGVHYKTFDGMVYTFQSPCQHILVRDPIEHKYSVAIKQGECKRHGYCPNEITVYLEEKPYILGIGEDGSVIFRSTKRLIPIPASLPGIRVSMPSDYVIVNLDTVGVAIKWDTNNLVQIEGSVLLWNNTEGLCGVLDGNPGNDLVTKEGLVVQSKSVLASSWKLNKIGDICETSPTETAACATETADDVTKAAKFCNEIISMKKFRKCSKVMDVLQFLEACKWDYCACTSTMNPEDCACNAISVYAKECLRHGVEEMKSWRDADTCPMKCPDGKFYKSCGADTQPSCAFPITPSKPENVCVEGCFCPSGLLLEAGKCVQKKECPCRLRNKSFPPGSVLKKDCNTCSCEAGEWVCTKIPCGARCRAVGDPHYTTFDGLRYDFMGHCTYTMLQAEDLTVLVENVACSGAITEAMNLTPYKGDGKPSCTKAVTLNYEGASIHLKQGGNILVNGKEVTTLPVMVGKVRIRAASSLFLVVQLPNKVDLWWDGNTRIFIDVPPAYHGKTKGLCGTFNLNQKDDFLTPENDIEQSTLAFANKWKTREFCSDESVVEPEHPCKANLENKEAAEKYCSILKGKVFEACHWHVDVEPYYESCLYDMCACQGDAARCLCPILGDYAMTCAKTAVIIQWRYNVKECELSCTGGQEYTVCADSCLRKCSDSALTSDSCEPSCVEGCACPQGQLLDDSGVCVPVALCPCYHKGLDFKAGYKEVRPGRRERNVCTCVGARWDCVPATPEDIQNYPPAEDLRSNCSATPNMEFTTCAKTEHLTCKNMHLPPSPLAAECRPGCRCGAGYVLDTASQRCVRPALCPCHHGGTSYPDGHKMQEECNQCECKSGNWSCSTRKCAGICSAWGDSHMVTFDGTDYDFEGVCTYLLAKGMMDGRDGFDVEIQNVPCGTTGATCSKSITLKVGSGNDEEIVSLTKNAPLPDISKLKRIKLRIAGVYVFLDVPSLGMSLQWDRKMRVYVKVDSMWQGRVKGLCGNYNGDMRDDFQTPSGGGLAESSPLIFADSWKLRSTCPKAQRIIDHCKQRPERKEWAASTCGALKRYPFTLCHAEVPAAPALQRCERDACACDAGGDCECACAALAHYAHECAQRGVTFKWRTQDMCPMQCDVECSNYDACVSACPIESCDNTLYYSEIKTNCEQDTCVEGCKPKKSCPEGQVYKNSSATECVPIAKCKPVCITLENGTEIAEGEVIEQDECHTCRCSKHQKICKGQPCASSTETEPEATSEKPNDQGLQCVTGWTPWLSRGGPETASNGDTLENEPLPKPNELHIGSPMCKPESMTDVECRTIGTHKSPKDTGLDVECSLERGLVCREKTALCPDFEIRAYCQCAPPNPCLNTSQPITPHKDCSKFIECGASGPVEKQCGPGNLFNPKTLVCDWPAAVFAVRPECNTGSTTTTASTEKTYTTHSSPSPPSTPTPPALCPPGQVFSDCAYPCDKMCDYFKKMMMNKGKCAGEKCVEGCIDVAVANIKCDFGSYWRDEKTCVPKKDCTCFSEVDNKIVKPGGVIVDGCLQCQCLDNDFHCDSSECVSVGVPYHGSTHQPMIIPRVINVPTTRSTPEVIPPETTPTTKATTKIPHLEDTTRLTYPEKLEDTTLKTVPEAEPPVTKVPEPIVIVKSTVTPPPECAPDNYIDLMWGDEPLPDASFSASSVASALFEPQFAQLNGHPLDITAGSWNPNSHDVHQYIQVELPRREPVYGVILQGSPLFDQYVTSYEVLYGDDGVVFHAVEENGQQKVFRGPVDHNVAMKQMISPPIEAKFVRVHPLSWHDEIAVRMELIGCQLSATTVTTTVASTITTTLEPLQCTEPLGIAADIPLDSITVSSNPEDKKHLVLEGERGWRPLYSTPGEWIMFNFTSPRNITGIKTKGGEKGWVTTYKVMFTSNLDNFNPILDKDGKERIFPANFNKDSVVTTEFRPPIHAQYLKLVPMKWQSAIELRVEPIGCFEPYPTPAPSPPTEVTTPSPCQLCPGVPAPEIECYCTPDQYYDGENCVSRPQCPCVISFMSYPVGSTFRGANCDECMCKIGGVTSCSPVKECKCDGPADEHLVPKLLPSTCECVCQPCPSGTKVCKHGKMCLPLEKWCDGLQDCPDDELDCLTEPPVAVTEAPVVTTQAVTVAVTAAPTTTAKPLECPVVACPPGYNVQYKASRARNPFPSASDLPPPRPRYSYQRYYKGGGGGYTKTGFSKGGFSKGGFSKGGFGGFAPPVKPSQSFTLSKPDMEPTSAPAAEACPQFSCVPPVPPFPRPGAPPAPLACSVVTCPPGYTLKLETLRGHNKCPQYECVPPPERPSFCNVTGRTFNTFDGSEYKYDVCFHILARENRLNTWTVVVRKKCRAEGCWNELLISQDDQLILVKPNMMIEYDNYEYNVEQTSKICFQKNSFDIARLGDGISIKSRKYNFTILFSKEGDVKIGVLKKHMGTVDGLCGAFDGDKANDRRLPDGQPAASTEQFGRAWGKPGMAPDACRARVVAAAKQQRVWHLCDVITKEPLARCGEMLSLDKWRSICLEKICECTDLVVNGTKRTEEQCRCILLQQMVAECLAADGGVDLAAWRIMMECPAECPAPLVHYDCFRRRCEPSCETGASKNALSCDIEEGSCYPGCYCPEGTLRKGDACVLPDDCLDCTCNGVGTPAKYVTFEGDELPFLCNCTYLASRDRNETGQHKYQVFATNAPCADNPSAMCTKSVHLAFEKKVIHVSKNAQTEKLFITIDDTAVYNLPLKEAWGSIVLDNGQDVTITLVDSHVELKVFASKMEFKVNVPSTLYGNQTEGLCGVCAGYQETLITSNGSATDSFEEYGKSWQATPDELTTLSIPPQEQCDQPPPVEDCTPPPDNPCINLYNADRFGACHALVDPASFVHSCEEELCANASACATLERYAAACRALGVCLEHWRTDLCPYPCDAPLMYRACVDCERTCENHDELAANPKKCHKQPVEGCFCPQGKVRVNSTCIEPTKCFPCDANREHFAGDEWQTNACTKCKCSKLSGERVAHVACTTDSCTTPACAAAEDLLTHPARPDTCCPTYVCVPKPKTLSCAEPKKMECGYGQVLKQKTTAEGCQEFACECKPASECETIPPDSEVEMFEPGMQRLIDHSGCCPKAELLCRKDTCPRAPACPQYRDLVTKNDTAKCCPEYSCELPKDKCLVKLEWEAAAKGGEKSRTTPQLVLKDLESVWLDGPCRSCRCSGGGGAGAAQAQCSVSACGAVLSTEQFVLEPTPVPFACCPAPLQVACRYQDNIYKVGENWTSSEDVCTEYKCVRHEDGALERVTAVRSCDDACQPGWEYQSPPAGECCGRCEPVACVLLGHTHKVGAVWRSSDHCVNYTCVNHNGTLQIQSANETCPEVPKALRKQFVLKEETVEGKCCPKVEAVACRVGNKVYQEGQTWQTSDPCKNITCARDAGVLSTQLHVENCAETCGKGWLYRPPAQGVCCGRCVEDSCVLGDELKKPGSSWKSADNCTSFTCERAGEEIFVTSSKQSCKDVSDCKPEYLKQDGCCPVCEEPPESLSKCVPQSIPTKETVGLIRKRVGTHGMCVNQRPLRGFKECRGACDSGALYDTLTGVHNTACECCSATKFSPMEVNLHCDDGSEQPHQLASPTACACRPCGASGNSFWGTKSGYGVKSPHPQRMVMTTQPTPTEAEDENEFIPRIYQRFGEH